jgi:hypothetical protein
MANCMRGLVPEAGCGAAMGVLVPRASSQAVTCSCVASGGRAGNDFVIVNSCASLRNEVKLAAKVRLERCVTGVLAEDFNT